MEEVRALAEFDVHVGRVASTIVRAPEIWLQSTGMPERRMRAAPASESDQQVRAVLFLSAAIELLPSCSAMTGVFMAEKSRARTKTMSSMPV